MRVAGVFSGIGGFELAFSRAGASSAALVEWDPKCQELLRAKFPGVPIFSDVRDVKGADLGNPDVLVGGFPCQDISLAGPRTGLAGERSGLFWEFARLLEEAQPRWFVLENVAGLLSSGGRRDLGTILRALGDRGYCLVYRVLDAQYFGVPQRRRRIFIVGHLGPYLGSTHQVLLEPEGRDGDPDQGREKGPTVAALTRSGLGGGGPDDNLAQAGHLIPAVVPMRSGKPNLGLTEDGTPPITASHGNPGMVAQPDGWGYAVRKLMPVECERLQGFPDGWTEGFPDTTRYRMLGNAVAVPVVEWIARRLIAVDRQEGQVWAQSRGSATTTPTDGQSATRELNLPGSAAQSA